MVSRLLPEKAKQSLSDDSKIFEKEKEIIKNNNFCPTRSELRDYINDSDDRKIL